MRRCWLLLLLALLAMLATVGAWAQSRQVVDLATRPAVSQRYLLLSPAHFDATLVLLVGGGGRLAIADDGTLGAGAGNFLARSSTLFLEQGLAVALVDAPSDRQGAPYLSGFRQSPEHATDLRAVMADVRQRTARPVVLVGTSRGTQSAAAVAIATAEAGGPDALVLTSSVLSDPKSRALPQMELDALRLPLLLVHHELDHCRVCQYADLPLLTAALKTPFTLRTYQGGISTGDPCEAYAYHGYNGIEARVVQDIAAWIRSVLPR